MRAALLLIDVQHDYLERRPLVPAADQLVDSCSRLLAGCRAQLVPVVHARTVVQRDGSNRMPHWRRADYWACVEGTRGCAAPDRLEPVHGERVVAKPYYSAFGNPELDAWLRELGTSVLVMAGLYLHACVVATALDAYQRGYEVWVAGDAVASPNAQQTEVARGFLDGRAAAFLDSADIMARLA